MVNDGIQDLSWKKQTLAGRDLQSVYEPSLQTITTGIVYKKGFFCELIVMKECAGEQA